MLSNNLLNLKGVNQRTWMTQLRKQNTSRLLGGLPSFSKGSFAALSADFLYKVYDAKAVTTQVVRSYQQKIKESQNSEPEKKPRELKFKSLVDELIEKSQKDQKNQLAPLMINPNNEKHTVKAGQIVDQLA